MTRLPADPETFIRANTALEAPAMVPEFRLWLASEYVPIWQATETWPTGYEEVRLFDSI